MHGYDLIEMKTGEQIDTPYISMKKNKNIQWNVNIYPKSMMNENFLNLYFNVKSTDDSKFRFETQYSAALLKNNSNNQVFEKTGSFTFSNMINGVTIKRLPEFIKTEELTNDVS